LKKVLVTGAAGFVGANLVRRLLQTGESVSIFLRPQSNLWRLQGILSDVHHHDIDLRNGDAVEAAVENIRPDIIYHLAVHGAYPSQHDVNTILQTNIMGSSHLIQACAKVGFESFINTGSSSEYGYQPHPSAENELPEPNSYYAVAKASCTMYCRFVSQKLQMPISTLRLYSVYGAYEEGSRLMPTLIKHGLHGELPPLVSPDTARDFIYIDDVLDIYQKVAAKTDLAYGEVFNVGTGIQRTLREVVDVARDVMHIEQEPQWGSMEGRSWDTNVWVADISHLRQTLDWEPQLDFREGFARMVTWFRENEHLYAN
jgi:nucleoside-diphosphate-sugar epimerase